VEQVDRGHLQAAEHSVDDLPDVRGTAVEAIPVAVRVDPESELRGDDDLVAYRCQSIADQGFVCERAVGLGSIEHRDAEVDGGTDERDALLPTRGLSVHALDAHAAVADR